MLTRVFRPTLLFVAIFVAMIGGPVVQGAEGAAGNASSAKSQAEKPKADTLAKDAASRGDVQKLVDQFKAQRESLIAAREAALARLKNATEEERKELLAKMHAEQKKIIEAQRARARQIRDEMRKLQPVSTPPGQR